MNTELFIASHILKSKSGPENYSNPIVKIAILGISLGVAIMIITLSVVTGFQKEIRDKVIGFGSHIQITNFDNNESFEATPIDRNLAFTEDLKKNNLIRHTQVFATKAGIIKTKNELQGVVVKGIGSDFDWDFFRKNIIEGVPFSVSDTGKTDKMLISKFHSEKLKIKINDTIVIFFIQNQQQRARKFSVSGIYETGMGDLFDQVFVLADIAHIQKLNGWEKDQIAGIEILLNSYENLDEATYSVNEIVGYEYLAKSIKDVNRQVFSWLDAQDVNAIVVIVLMALVAAINMISALLVLILERTQMIGVLKAIGMKNWSVRKIFLLNASYLIGVGMLLGNMAGIILCLLQKHFHLISLDESAYYLSSVPINLNYLHIALLNTGTFILCLSMLIIPSYIITYITPIKAMKFA